MKMLVLAALTALVSGCWSGVSVTEDGNVLHTIDVGDMSCVSCEYEITASNAVIIVVFKKDSANEEGDRDTDVNQHVRPQGVRERRLHWHMPQALEVLEAQRNAL